MKKILAVIFIISLAILASCGGDSGNQTENTSDTSSNVSGDTGEDVTDEIKEAAAERIYPDLEAVDFEGYTFTFLGSLGIGADWVEWSSRDLVAEEINGDVINDAVYNRNKKIEEKYNIKIENDIRSDATAATVKTINAGDDAYDVVCPRVNAFVGFAQNGALADFFQVPTLDLSQPWWDQGTVRDLSIMHKLFAIQGDLLIIDNDAMEAMIFNKTLLKEHALESPYDIVNRGEWTFDKLTEMYKGIAKDLDGDGQMYILDDLFGCIVQADSSPSFLVSGGEKICSKNGDDYPIITFGSERTYRITDAISALMLDEDNVVMLHRYNGVFPIYDEQVKMFSEDRALFSWIRMRIVERLRGMETDFGIIPCPKLDTAQEKYITRNNPHAGAVLCIPVSASNLERTGMILEDLSAESRYTLQPAYYEINLYGKFARDEESREMLDIILGNTAHDIGYIYNFGDFREVVLRYGINKQTEYASAFDAAKEKMEKDIEKLVAAYEKLD